MALPEASCAKPLVLGGRLEFDDDDDADWVGVLPFSFVFSDFTFGDGCGWLKFIEEDDDEDDDDDDDANDEQLFVTLFDSSSSAAPRSV